MSEFELIEEVMDEGRIERTYRFPKGVSVNEAAILYGENVGPLEGYRCRHSYDCCANWYPNQAKVEIVDGQVVIRQVWYQNI